jgi:hypothetical protein
VVPRRSSRRVVPFLVVVVTVLLVFALDTPRAEAGSTAGWTIVTTPDTGPLHSDFLLSTNCTGAWNCWAVGGAFRQEGPKTQPYALADHWNGSSWSAGPSASPPDTRASLLWSVDCVTGSDCWAVGGQEVDGAQAPEVMAEHWNGTAWSVAALPPTAGYLFSVACTSPSDCWASGNDLDSQKNPRHAIMYHWNGASWSEVSLPRSGQPYDQLNSVTCTGGSDCWAAGYAGPSQVQYGLFPQVLPRVTGGNGLIEHWNGSAWSIVSTPATATPSGGYLSSVTCTGTSDCWTVGTRTDAAGNPSNGLIEHWNGSAWSILSTPGPATPFDLLTDVTCTDSTSCWASGAADTAAHSDTSPIPFIEHWNGATWSVDPSPSVLAVGYLSGIACRMGSGCFAAGFAGTTLNATMTFQTLIEQMTLPAGANQGVWMAGSDGGVFAFGTAAFDGSAGGEHLNAPVVGTAAMPGGGGYWLVGSDGGVFAFGTAGFHGSAGSLVLNKPIVGITATPDGRGYWLVGSDGGVFAFGDAVYHGSTGSLPLNRPIVGMATTPDGGGYWLVASDGGVFAFGDAAFFGSTGGLGLTHPIVGMATTPDGGGYWLVASDGGVFAFGDASFYGSVPGQGIVDPAPVAGVVATPDGRGYWIVGRDGALYSYGDAAFLGSLVGNDLDSPIVGSSSSS